ncbi:ribosome small subunit-dependent GTPase A [Pseudochryseolinea flava]|nr:ribosome small subunit-dependent GTPase A [Pseudochryseolinea flava]
MISLNQYGWDHCFQSSQTQSDLLIGRVTSIQGFKYYIITIHGEKEAELSGKLLYEISAEELPKVGDWVTMKDYETMGYIIDVLPRKNVLSRKNPGSKTERQLLATNIDYALVVQGLDRDFNIMRLERYIVQLMACSITPIVVLNKADLVNDWNPFSSEISTLQRDCKIHFCSTYNGIGIDELFNSVLEPRKTYILIGSSGVGKSSLLNALMNNSLRAVSDVSTFNNKGKHTTTTRDLFLLPNDSIVIDTPGMREFGLTFERGHNDDELFPAIHQFAAQCRFSDCKHLHEKDCAVIAAVERGELEKQVYESYLKLVKEQRRFEMNAEDKKRLGKIAGKMSREAQENRKKYKY